MAAYFVYPPNVSGSGIATYANFAAFPASAADGTLALALDTDILYAYNVGLASWVVVGGPGAALSIGTIDSQTKSANGAVIAANALVMQNADATHPGLVSIGVQSIAGAKTFTGVISASNLSGTNSGDVTLAAVGAVPNANGASLSGQVLNLQPADGTNPGVLTTGAQTIAGAKTFSSTIVGSVSGNAATVTTNANLTGPITSVGNTTSVASQTGTGSTFVMNTAPTMTNPVVGTQSQGDSSTKAASTSYVDVAVANAIAGVNPAVAVQAATTAAGDTSSFVYNNGVSGIGATLTSGSTNTALTVDGYTFTALGQRLLVKNDTQSPSGAFNGVYYVTQVQALGLPIILTRALDYDAPSDMNNTGAIPVINGTANGTTSWVLTSLVVTVGTTPLTFTEFTRNPADYLLKANNLSDVSTPATAFNNISGMTTLGDTISGGASGARNRVAGNITTTKKFYTQTGDGANSAAPGWNTIVGSDLPNPSSSTLGGVQSIAAVSHQFMTTISTSGVPALAQPAFTDITGTATVAQVPAITSADDIQNLSLAASVGSSALTIALKDASGADATATSPVRITFRSATAATGTVTQRSVTAALSTVISSGSTAGHFSNLGSGSYLFIYALDNAGTVELAWSSKVFADGSVQTTTAEGGAGAADSSTTLYSTTARSNVPIRLIGRMLSPQTTAGTWAAVPTEIVVGKQQSLMPQTILQVFCAGNGYGSGNTKVRKYTTQTVNSGNLNASNDATTGLLFNILVPGFYEIARRDNYSVGAAYMGLSRNASNSTNLTSLTYETNMIGLDRTATANDILKCNRGIYLNVGDVISPHDDSQVLDSTTNYESNISIQWVSW